MNLLPEPRSVEIVGYLAATLTTLAFVPQVLKTWRSRSTGDLSLPTLAAFSAGVFLWLVYGLALGSMPVIAANATTLALNMVLLGLKLRHKRDLD
jgi:MtN3 and saliva related transmembrane protein